MRLIGEILAKEASKRIVLLLSALGKVETDGMDFAQNNTHE